MSSNRCIRTCTLCEAMCGITVDVKDDVIESIRGDGDDPFSRGHICPKAIALKDLHEDPDRLRRPLRREGTTFRSIEWDEALDEAAQRLRRVQTMHGRDAVAFYQGNPTVHNYGSMLFAPDFARALRTKNLYSATSVDQLPHMVAAHAMFGHQLLLPVPDLDRTNHLLVFGANPVVSNGSLMTAPDVTRRLRDIRARGGKVVVIDPRRTETAAIATEHHFIRPGADAFVLLGMLHELFTTGAARLGHCAAFTDGLEELADAVAPFSPERVAPSTGLEAEAIKRLTAELAGAERAAVYGRMGASTQEFGALSCVLINALNLVTGNLDREGGAMFTQPAVDILRFTSRGGLGRRHSRVRKLPAFAGELPVAALAEEIDTPGEGQIRALVTSAGNPVLSTPNGARLERALGRLDFMVSIDFYQNETTRFAHLILPPTGPLEHDHYDLAFHALAIRNTAKLSPAVFTPPPGTRHDWQIFNELTWRVQGGSALTRLRARARAAAMALLGPRSMLDLALRAGSYGVLGARPEGSLSVDALERSPHGIDLGPLRPCLPRRLFTTNKRILLAPAALLADLTRVARRLDERAVRGDELSLVGRRQLRSNNSWLHNSLRLVKGPARCTLLIHPEDAAARGIRGGDPVRVRSRVGSVVAPAEVSDEMMRGVVSLPHGWGHGREGARLSVADRHPGVSLNDLTDDTAVDALSGNAALSDVPVTVTREEASPA